ncbi:MAG: glycosyltransferase family 4 protein [Planctomycetia bacterium]|uniref:glycosyltransferase family 4 protein n=1 Tax=Candidatus Kuenenia sp. TaxID=2499824 RepID=UPI001DC4967E|nr:glycosyltransferase family 4 protein [Planctomycetia bacterium]MCF6151995.1 glycosyltransferase family 1 protein [Candidatus Kuenenia stuttgartiensis]
MTKELKKRKIVFISHASDLYGAPRCLLELLKKIDTNKYVPIIIFPADGPLINRINTLGIPTYIIPRKFSHDIPFVNGVFVSILNKLKNIKCIIRYVLKLTLFIFKQKPDLIYVNTLAHCSPLIASKILRIPILLHMHEPKSYVSYNSIGGKLRSFAVLYLPNQFICVSKATKNLLIDKGIPDKKITVVYNGVNTEEFKPFEEMRQKKRKELGANDANVLVGFIGQIVSRKGIEEFLEAASMVREKEKKFKFIVVGGPLDASFFKSRILPLYTFKKLEECLTFTGFREDVKSYLSAIDIFVNPSREEPFGLVNLEAMAMEKAIVATRTGGSLETIIDSETGYIVPVGDVLCLSKRILELTEDKELRNYFGKNSRKRVMQYFTVEQYYSGVQTVINKVLKVE